MVAMWWRKAWVASYQATYVDTDFLIVNLNLYDFGLYKQVDALIFINPYTQNTIFITKNLISQ